MKQLKFEHKYAEDIVSGVKSATFRVNDDKDIKPGDVVELVDKVNGDRPKTWQLRGQLNIKAVSQLMIGELTKEHLVRAESFANTAELIQSFRRFYGEHIDGNSLVNVLEFDFKPYDEPRLYIEQSSAEEIPPRVWLYADGGSRGNPGPSALGFVILDEHKQLLHGDNKYLGITTNNQAEYHSLIAGLEWCIQQGVRELSVCMDSLLVVNQINGKFKVRNRDLWSLYEKAKTLSTKFSKIHFSHVPRELNKLADAEVNRALDAVKGDDIVQ